jgi:hypothetical protein
MPRPWQRAGAVDRTKVAKTELFVILARAAPVGVVFRRGPSRRTLLLKWHLRGDTFDQGQWFKGRIYARRCDLSPSGQRLIYFAANHRRHGPGTWTAISRPPYLTALALWPKGDTWGGGGLFASEDQILLNHRQAEFALADGARLGKNVRVRPLGDRAGYGEDKPIHHQQMTRDGWVMTQACEPGAYSHKRPALWQFITPEIYEKTTVVRKRVFVLRRILSAIGERQGDWYVVDHDVLDKHRQPLVLLPRTSWADWGGNGDLLFAERGKLFRLPARSIPGGRAAAVEVADLSSLIFEERTAPPAATRW